MHIKTSLHAILTKQGHGGTQTQEENQYEPTLFLVDKYKFITKALLTLNDNKLYYCVACQGYTALNIVLQND